MELCISSNGYKVLESGTVILYDRESEMTMNLQADNGFNFSIIFKFITKPHKERKLNKEVQENKIVLECINFDNKNGTGTIKPLPIATVDGKEWFLHFCAYTMAENSPHKIDYTIFEKE